MTVSVGNASPMNDTKSRAVDAGTYLEIQRFLFREAALLDRRDYEAWLALTAEDIHYRVTAAVTRDAAAQAIDRIAKAEKPKSETPTP